MNEAKKTGLRILTLICCMAATAWSARVALSPGMTETE